MSAPYPTQEQLKTIRDWNILASYEKFLLLMEFIKPLWFASELGYWKEHDGLFEISTAGWSGNEEIISALEENLVFWALYFCRLETGGHYIFASMDNWHVFRFDDVFVKKVKEYMESK